MSRKLVLLMTLMVFLMGMLSVAFKVKMVEASGTITIRADGSIDPPTPKITSLDNITYTFTANITDSIVVERSNIIIEGNGYTLQGNRSGMGISLHEISNVTIKNTKIEGFWYGVYLNSTSHNIISGNNITKNSAGIYLDHSSNNSIVGNNITNNGNSVIISYSFGNILSGNMINGNRYSFGPIWGTELRHFMHSIDVSNLVDGKSIYYLVNQTDLVINPATHPQVGYLGLVNCTNVRVEGLSLTNNGQGLLLANTNNSKIIDNNVTNNADALWLGWSSNNTLSGNNITNNGYGLDLWDSSNHNIISGNKITNNDYYGIRLSHSSNNTITENNITDTYDFGIQLSSSSDNKFYHNNFVDNTQQVRIDTSGYANFWDDGVEGNYWSNYTGVDLNHDGIGDSPHVIDAYNQDNFPLMGMFHSFNIPLGYSVNVISNSTIEDFTFFESNSTIRMYISNSSATQSFGFCRVCIPKNLMSPPYTVMIDDGSTEVLYFNATIYDNDTHRWIYFAYEHSTYKVDIIPEFPTWTPMLLIFIVLTVATVTYKRRLLKTPVH